MRLNYKTYPETQARDIGFSEKVFGNIKQSPNAPTTPNSAWQWGLWDLNPGHLRFSMKSEISTSA